MTWVDGMEINAVFVDTDKRARRVTTRLRSDGVAFYAISVFGSPSDTPADRDARFELFLSMDDGTKPMTQEEYLADAESRRVKMKAEYLR